MCSTCVRWANRLPKVRFGSLMNHYQPPSLIKFSIVLNFYQIFTLKPNLSKQVQHHSVLIRSLHHHPQPQTLPTPPQTSISFYLVDLFVCNARCSEQPHTFVQVILVLLVLFSSICLFVSSVRPCVYLCSCRPSSSINKEKQSKANNKWRCPFL